MPFQGFPRGTLYTPVPNSLFGPLLEEIDDLVELKCTLRVIWLLHNKKRGSPRRVALKELLKDSTLLSALSTLTSEPASAITAAMACCVRRGTFLSAKEGPPEASEQVYLLNTEANRRALSSLDHSYHQDDLPATIQETEGYPPPTHTSIFVLYEENIGMLTPLLADQLKEAENTYPAQWIQEAFRLAVENNHRSWRYISRILERWSTEGKDNGKPGRHTSKSDPQRYIKDYLRRRGRLPRAE